MTQLSHDQLLQLALQNHRGGRLGDAATLYQQVLRHNPNEPTALHMLGVLAGQMGQWETAVELIRRSITLVPGEALAHSNLAKLFYDHGDFAESAQACREAVRLDPRLAEGQYNLGNALYAQDDVDGAIASFQQAIALRPDYAKAYHNMANAHKDRAELGPAVAAARRVVELCPQIPESHSNLIFTMLFHPQADPVAIRAECENFNRRHALPLAPAHAPQIVTRDRDRPLRIGYISPDFREHCQALFTIPLFSHHDHARFHITAYSDVRRPDATTERLRRCCDEWRTIAGMDHAVVAETIRRDHIDILVDLTMHMANNRLLVFARTPAPVQVSWLAFPGTTGVSAINYRLTDPYLDPPTGAADSHDHFYTEKSIRLPDTFWCYASLCDVAVNALPAKTNGYITFGCLNNFAKITDEMLQLWAGVLQKLPNSQLLLLAPEGTSRTRALQSIGEAVGKRIRFTAFLPRLEYLKLYHQIDVALDTFPVNGHTTSLDALWMGVPVVTRFGPNPLGRAGLSQLTNLGLQELIAQTPEEYVRIATDLAGHSQRLAALRSTLRQRMQASPLMDAARFTRNVESAFAEMHHNLRR